MVITNGSVVTQEFQKAADSVETLYQIFSLCGPRSYRIVELVNAAYITLSWSTVTAHATTADRWIITFSPTLDTQDGTHSFFLEVKLSSNLYTAKAALYEPLQVTVSSAACNCQLLTWDNPTRVDVIGAVGSGPYTATIPLATVNVASKSTTPAIRSCFKVGGPGCNQTSTVVAIKKGGSALPASVTQTGTTTAITYTPTTAAHMGVWLLSVTQTTASGPDPVFDCI